MWTRRKGLAQYMKIHNFLKTPTEKINKKMQVVIPVFICGGRTPLKCCISSTITQIFHDKDFQKHIKPRKEHYVLDFSWGAWWMTSTEIEVCFVFKYLSEDLCCFCHWKNVGLLFSLFVVLFVVTFSWQGGRFVGDQWMAAALFCSVGTAFIRPITTDSKIECRSDSREYHLYWRCKIYLVIEIARNLGNHKQNLLVTFWEWEANTLFTNWSPCCPFTYASCTCVLGSLSMSWESYQFRHTLKWFIYFFFSSNSELE